MTDDKPGESEKINQVDKALRNHSVQDALATLNDIAVHHAGLLSGIPVVGTAVKTLRAGKDLRDYLFAEKIKRFLGPLENIPSDQRSQMMAKMSDPDFQEKVGGNLILLLDRLDDVQKPIIIGRLFKAYLMGFIDLDTLRRLNTAVDRVIMPDLELLSNYYSAPAATRNQMLADDLLQSLAVCGLADMRGDGVIGGSGMRMGLNELSEQLYKHGLVPL